MITVSLSSLSQNVRTLQRTSNKKVFVDLSFDAFGLGAESLYRHLTFVSDGVLWEHSVPNNITYAKLKKRFPMISARSGVPRLALDVASAQNTIVTLKSIGELNNLVNYGGKDTKVRVLFEYTKGPSLGLSEDELNFCLNKFETDPSYKCVIPIGLICNDGLLSNSEYKDLKFKYPDLDICCYDSVETSDVILASSFAYGYSKGRRCSKLHPVFSITGNVTGIQFKDKTACYITDLTSDKELETKVNGNVYKSQTVVIGGIPHIAFTLPKAEIAPKYIKICNPEHFLESVSLIKQLSHEEKTYIHRPIPTV